MTKKSVQKHSLVIIWVEVVGCGVGHYFSIPVWLILEYGHNCNILVWLLLQYSSETNIAVGYSPLLFWKISKLKQQPFIKEFGLWSTPLTIGSSNDSFKPS